MTTCAICLNSVRETRVNTLRCGHIFHTHCLEKWKEKGNITCPTCRKVFCGDKYKVTIKVDNNFEETSNTATVSDSFVCDVLDIFFNVVSDSDLTSLLSSFGMSPSDFDPSIFDTE
jgi:hypothetical protein